MPDPRPVRLADARPAPKSASSVTQPSSPPRPLDADSPVPGAAARGSAHPGRRVSRAGGPGRPERSGIDPVELDVASIPRNVALVRRYCVDACSELGWAESAGAVELLVSELATNAVVHAGGSRMRMRVRVLDLDQRLRVEVSDNSTALPVPRRAAADAENGRGLALVDTLAVDAGCDVGLNGKTAWFEVGP